MSHTIPPENKRSSIFKLFVQAIRGDVKEFTSGSINRAIFLLAVPMVFEMLLEAFFAIVDIYFVNGEGTAASSTVVLTEGSLTILYSVAWGMAMGVTAMVARRSGEKDLKAASEIAAQAILLAVVFSLLISIVGLFFSKQILMYLGADKELADTHYRYTQIMLTGNVVIMLLFINNGIFRGVGDASIAMRSLLLSNAINIVLVPVLIRGIGPFPKMGVVGAAVATTIGRGCGVLYQFYHLFKGKDLIKLTKKHFKPHFSIISNILRTSWGGMFQFLIGSCSWIFLMRIIAGSGEKAMAGYGTAIRICIFTILPAWGLANAAATLVGQNLGAGRPERAERSVWRTAFIAFCFFILVAVVFFFFGEDLMRFFIHDTEAIAFGTLCLHILSIGYVFFAYGMVIGQAFNGAGDTRTPTLINLVVFWAIQIPMAYLLAKPLDQGPVGVYIAIGTSEAILAVVSVILFRRGKWKLIKI